MRVAEKGELVRVCVKQQADQGMHEYIDVGCVFRWARQSPVEMRFVGGHDVLEATFFVIGYYSPEIPHLLLTVSHVKQLVFRLELNQSPA